MTTGIIKILSVIVCFSLNSSWTEKISNYKAWCIILGETYTIFFFTMHFGHQHALGVPQYDTLYTWII